MLKMKRSKAYRKAAEQIDASKVYTPKEAFKLLKEVAFAKFDESVEVHLKLGIDPRHADQQLRGTLSLPHGTGKTTRIVVIAEGEKATDAKNAGADEVGSDDIIERISGGWLDFDLLIATPAMMAKLGKLGRVLGSKGLMPNPKSGTVTQDISTAVKEFKAGRVEYRNDKAGIIHLAIGKKSFDEKALEENFMLVYDTLQKMKPAKAKGVYMKSISVATTQGVGIFIEPMQLKWAA